MSDSKRLLILASYFHPDRGGGAAVNTDLCLALAKRGFKVTVWAPYPHYPEWSDKTGQNGWQIRSEEMGEIHVQRFGLFIPRDASSLWQRMLYEASYLLSLLRRLSEMRHYDVTMAFCPQVASLAVAAVGATLFRKPLWLNVQDMAAEAAAAGGIVRNGWLSKLLRGSQTWLFNRADLWSSISPVMIKRLETLRQRDQQIVYLPNWLNESLAVQIRQLPEKIGRAVQQPMRLLYAGNLGRKQNLVRLLTALQQCDAIFEFHLHGSGGDAAKVDAWFASCPDARFVRGPFLDERQFADAIHECDFFVLPEIEGSGASFLPSKLTAIMACATPVICICDPQSPLGYEMSLAACGPMLHWDQLSSVGQLLKQWSEAPEQFVQWQTNAKARSKVYDRQQIVDSCSASLLAMCQSDGKGNSENP